MFGGIKIIGTCHLACPHLAFACLRAFAAFLLDLKKMVSRIWTVFPTHPPQEPEIVAETFFVAVNFKSPLFPRLRKLQSSHIHSY